jgi:hypothetical protein
VAFARPSVFRSRRGIRTCVTDRLPPLDDNGAWSSTRPAARRKEDPQMELAALVLFGSIVLWFFEEARGTGSL